MVETLAIAEGPPSVAAAERARRLYEKDGYTWALEQASALRGRDLDAIDWDNLIEEVEGWARSERRSWESLCARAIQHLLLIQFWGARFPNALDDWIREIENLRDDMAEVIRENPGLQGKYASMFSNAWRRGRRWAHRELVRYEMQRSGAEGRRRAQKTFKRHWDTRLPSDCPYSLQDVTAFDAERDREPRDEVWPPMVARVLDGGSWRGYAPDRQELTPD